MAPLYQRARGQLGVLLQQCQAIAGAASALQPAALSLVQLAAAVEAVPDAGLLCADELYPSSSLCAFETSVDPNICSCFRRSASAIDMYKHQTW